MCAANVIKLASARGQRGLLQRSSWYAPRKHRVGKRVWGSVCIICGDCSVARPGDKLAQRNSQRVA
eukprot:2845136-Lingulodinium_polyedra.AAC.1